MLPDIRYNGREKTSVYSTFRGLGGNRAAVDGALMDCINCSDAAYPAVQSRKARKIASLSLPDGAYTDSVTAFGVFGGDFVCVTKTHEVIVSPNRWWYLNGYINGVQVMRHQIADSDANKKRSIVEMNGTLIVFPDGYILRGGREKIIACQNGETVTLETYTDDGIRAIIYNVTLKGTAEGSGRNRIEIPMGSVVMDTVNKRASLFCKGDAVYLKAEVTDNFGNYFERRSEAKIITEETYLTGESDQKIVLDFADGAFDELLISSSGRPGFSTTYNYIFTVVRGMPELDGVMLSNNRVWGYKDKELFCSKLGDAFNWYVMQGLASDSWTWDAGGNDSFTGCGICAGYPIFFRERSILKVCGTGDGNPANFATVEYPYAGVKAGCADTVAACGKYLFYMGLNGIYAYSGGVPSLISGTISDRFRTEGVALSDGVRYYISAKDGNGASKLYVYNTVTGLWYAEDAVQLVSGGYENGLWAMLSDKRVVSLGDYTGERTVTEESAVPFMLETTDFILGAVGAKTVNRIIIRYEGDTDAGFSVSVSYDGGDYTMLANVDCTGARKSTSVHLSAHRRDSMRIKLTGSGNVTIYSIALEGQVGSGVVH